LYISPAVQGYCRTHVLDLDADSRGRDRGFPIEFADGVLLPWRVALHDVLPCL